MKKKIAILLASVMTAAMLPMNVMASSSNSINKTVTVAVDKVVDGVYLNIRPNDEVVSGDVIAITLEGGEFIEDGEKIDDEVYNFDDFQYNVAGYDWAKANAVKGATDTIKAETLIATILEESAELPYFIKRNGDKELQVSLYPVPSGYVGKKYNETVAHYHIPLPIKATVTGDIKVTVDANETSISGGGTYTVATATSSSGSTTTTVEEIEKFEDLGKIKPITIKENVYDTFDAGETVTLRLSGGFNFKKNNTITIAPGINADFKEFTVTKGSGQDADNASNADEFTFTMPDVNSNKAAAIRIEGIEVEADDEDEDYGEVKLTVSGADITKETIVIGERTDFGFALTVLDEVPTLIAGRFEYGEGKIYDDECEAAQFKFEETIPNTWLTQRKLEFTVPDGVQIYNYEIEDEENLSIKLDSIAELTNDNRTLKINREADLLSNDEDETAEFKVTLYLSADADFEGEVTVSVAGGGVAEGVIDDVVVANVIAPIAITSTETKTNMGYQSVATSDITITEAEEGIFIKNNEVSVAIDASFGTQEIGFADEGITYEIDSTELEITNFDVNEGAITFEIDKESYNEPASITFKNVKVGTTRSVPYGSFDIKVGGTAVINNYDEDADLDDDAYKGWFDTTGSYSFKNYLTIGTVTGTLDSVVKVTIGEKTVLINDQANDMDVAPYIQASSNSTMVPLRFVAVALGVDPSSISNPDESSKVSWNADTKTVTIYYGAGNSQKIIQFQAGSNVMTVDGTEIPMENGVVAEIKDSRMFVPFRALGNALGVNVTWDADTKTATYNAQA